MYLSIPYRSTVYLGIAFLDTVFLITEGMATVDTREGTTCGGGSFGTQGIGIFALDASPLGLNLGSVLKIRERRTGSVTAVDKR